MQIRVEDKGALVCNFPKEGAYRCGKRARAWVVEELGTILIACAECGEPVIEALERTGHERAGKLSITGCYDDPKSKLEELRESIEENTDRWDGKFTELFTRLIDYMEEKEKEA